MTVVEPEIGNTEMNEGKLLAELRRLRRALRLHPADMPDPMEVLSVGQRIADVVASIIGSWPFIIVQTALLAAWLAANLLAAAQGGDPYPFILLNLALSFQSAYAAPIIMMSQNRQQAIDRMAAENDYRVKIKAELEIELLHEKIDELRAQATIRGGKGACRPVGSADTVKGGSARERSRLMHAPSIRCSRRPITSAKFTQRSPLWSPEAFSAAVRHPMSPSEFRRASTSWNTGRY